jgi:two-component system chemotaxis sensor kinase CheA
VPVSLLDNLMTLMGEMVLVRNQVLQFSNKSEDLEFLSMSKRLNVVTTEIQGEMMKTRMQPIGNVLTKFNRVVRDLSQELSKNLNITLQGADTELDKSLLEAIKDPLTHIVRNSCDHGIETPEVRRKSGKPEVGTIAIKAYHEGGQVVIEITDDGKGLHKDMLVNKAIEKGVLTTIQAAKMTEKEIFNLIFAPGFSTAAKITNVSGRGVGMDVVRTNIERIGGTVDLASEAGRGTQIKIKIPLTLAIVPALLVKCGTGTFAIPQVKLEELVRVDQSSGDNRIEYLHGSPVYRLRGNILPLVDLNKILGTRPGGENPDPTIINIAVLNAEQCSFGVIIDEVQDTADIVVKPLNRLLKSLQVYSGATVLGDGSIALIFDVLGLSKVAQLGHSKEKNQASNNALAEKTRKLTELQDFLLVRLNSATKHAIVLNYVNRLEEFKTTDIELSGNQRVIRYRDLILPLISASEQLGYPRNDAKTETKPVVVIQRAGAFYGIEVEEILDTLSTDSEVDAGVVKQPGIFGNLNTKEELIVVVDPFELINRCFPDMNSSNGIETMLQTSNVKQIQPPQNAIIAARASGRVLLVEDTVFFRKAIKSVLEKTGYEVITANDGREALEILNKQGSAFDVIVSDIEMPRMNGFQLAEQVRHHPVYANIGMLAVSSRADSKSMTEGSKAGFDLYLEKLKPAVLISAVEQVMKKRKSAA